MKKEEMAQRIKGLEGLVEAQRNTIQELAEKTKKIGNEKKVIFEIISEESIEQTKLNITEEDLHILNNFINIFNQKTEEVQITIYKEVIKDE